MKLLLVFLALVPGVLSLLFLEEARSARRERHDALDRIGVVAEGFSRRDELMKQRWEALLRSLRAGQEALRGELATATRSSSNNSATRESRGVEVAPVEAPPEADDTIEPPLPAVLPGQRTPQHLVRNASFEELVAAPELNPDGKKLSHAQAVRLRAELARDRARLEWLENEAKLHVLDGMDRLRTDGAYIEYGSDEAPDAVPGVLSAGEGTEYGGTRMFYLYPEDFPEIYALREERSQLAKRAIARLVEAFKV